MKKTVKRQIFNKKNIIILSVIAFISLIGVTYGRYIYNGIRNYYLSSKNFYFNSDKLEENISRYQIDNWSGVDPVTITINMDSRKNNKVSSQYDILYDIAYECSPNVTCVANKDSGIILSNTNTDYFSIVMTPLSFLSDGDSIWLEVEANASSPYTKKLRGLFVINVGTKGLSYEIVDEKGSPYFDFNITNTIDYYRVLEAFDNYAVEDHIDISTYLSLPVDKKKKCSSSIITLSFDPSVLRLDMTNEAYLNAKNTTVSNVDGYDYINSVTFGIEAISSSKIRFYKLNTANDYSYPYVNNNSVVTFLAS